jgi:thiol-disulfide isomerase/thioredoxin
MRINILRRVFSLAGFILVAAWTASAQSTSPDAAPDLLSSKLQATNADAAWTELEHANRPPTSPAAWRDTTPTEADKLKYYRPYMLALADKAKDFYSKFPKDGRATQAKVMEFQLVLQSDAANQKARLAAAGKLLLNDPAITGENHLALLWILAQNSPIAEARPMLQEITNSPTQSRLKDEAAQFLRNLEFVGRPLNLQFTAVDGRSVDLAKFKGKVVLLDFWATWCPPCLAEVPNVKKTYDEFHPKGFEIIGISYNHEDEKPQLTQFVADHKMEWPQFFETTSAPNRYAVQFGVEFIPTMWLIDKKGVVRDVRAGEDLSGGVQKLLAE